MKRLDIPLAPTVFPNGGDKKKGKKELRKAKRKARKNYRQDNKLTKEERKERNQNIAITAGMNAAAYTITHVLPELIKK